MPFTGISSNERFTASQIQEDVAQFVAALSPKETEFLDFRLVLIVELDSIQSLIGLFPHFHDKEVSIQSVFSLFVAVWSNHCEHGMNAD